MKTELIYYQKLHFRTHYVLEMKIYGIEKSSNYPDGVKYSLIVIDTSTGRKVLLDNHHPKGHHLHLDSKEFPYEFKTVEKLVEDFKNLVLEQLGVKL